MLQMEPVGEAIFLGEMLMGIDLEGDEPGDDSKYILVGSVVGGSACVCIYTTGAGVLGREGVAREVFFLGVLV